MLYKCKAVCGTTLADDMHSPNRLQISSRKMIAADRVTAGGCSLGAARVSERGTDQLLADVTRRSDWPCHRWLIRGVVGKMSLADG